MFVSALSACATLYQKRAADPTIEGCESLCGSGELNSGPLAASALNRCVTSPVPQITSCFLIVRYFDHRDKNLTAMQMHIEPSSCRC